jgi:hypothetical protein
MNNNIFDIIDWVLKNKNSKPKSNEISKYILNRWLSMSQDLEIVKIINLTTNRWFLKNDNLNVVDFYHQILPQYKKNIKYIKKTNTDNDFEDLKNLANNMEVSKKEILFLQNALDELQNISK